MNTADSNTSLPEKKSGYSFGHNETLLLISLYQKYEVFFSDVSYKKPVIRGMCLLSFVYRTAKTFGKSKTVSLFSSSLFTRKNCCDNRFNGSLFVGRHTCYAMFTRVRTAHLDVRFFMQTIQIIPSIPYQPFLFQNCGLKNAPLVVIPFFFVLFFTRERVIQIRVHFS